VASGEVKTVGGDKFEVQVADKDGTVVEVDCRDNQDGTYVHSHRTRTCLSLPPWCFPFPFNFDA